jgi:hypothetical protein
MYMDVICTVHKFIIVLVVTHIKRNRPLVEKLLIVTQNNFGLIVI